MRMPQQWDAHPPPAAKGCQLDGYALLLFFTGGSVVNEFLHDLLSQDGDCVTAVCFGQMTDDFLPLRLRRRAAAVDRPGSRAEPDRSTADPLCRLQQTWGVSGTQRFDAPNNPPASYSAAASQRSCPLSEDRPFTPSFWKVRCRCSFTVPLLSPSSRATCLLDKPRATRRATSRSRGVNPLDRL